MIGLLDYASVTRGSNSSFLYQISIFMRGFNQFRSDFIVGEEDGLLVEEVVCCPIIYVGNIFFLLPTGSIFLRYLT